jgi:hypothetical protein
MFPNSYLSFLGLDDVEIYTSKLYSSRILIVAMNDLFIDFNFSKSYISNNTEFTSELKSMK